jgi:hypothetical protein
LNLALGKVRATMLDEKTSHLSGGKDDDVPDSVLNKEVPWFKKWYPNWVKECVLPGDAACKPMSTRD